MLPKLLAVWIITLAASPFTQPFSTVTLVDWQPPGGNLQAAARQVLRVAVLRL
jgi:hypothetical protein